MEAPEEAPEAVVWACGGAAVRPWPDAIDSTPTETAPIRPARTRLFPKVYPLAIDAMTVTPLPDPGYIQIWATGYD